MHTYNPVLGRLRQEGGEFKASPDFIPRPCSNNNDNKRRNYLL
jgi:hypothetical protein